MTTQVLDHGFVRKVNHGNNDLTVVNAARVSMGKEVSEFVYAGTPEAEKRKAETGMGPDDGLIKYLAKHNHWTPFAHVRLRFSHLDSHWQELALWAGSDSCSAGFTFETHIDRDGTDRLVIEGSLWGWLRHPPPVWQIDSIRSHIKHACPVSFSCVADGLTRPDPEPGPYPFDTTPISTTLHLKLPIFVARQLMRSNVGIVYNEVSRRYVDDEPVFHWPHEWRGRADNVKQGSAGVVSYRPDTFGIDEKITGEYVFSAGAEECCLEEYISRLKGGVAPEQARAILPQSLYTELWMTASHDALRRLVGLREDPHAQWEIRQYAEAIREACPEVFAN